MLSSILLRTSYYSRSINLSEGDRASNRWVSTYNTESSSAWENIGIALPSNVIRHRQLPIVLLKILSLINRGKSSLLQKLL